MLIQACVNGSRPSVEHPRLPVTPEQIAREAVTLQRAGAACLHVHPRRTDGTESLAAADVGAVLQAVREVCPAIPVSVSTAAWIEPDLRERMSKLESWSVLPDLASVNLSEDGALAIIDLLNERGVGVEAGVWTVDDAHVLIDNGLQDACARVLVEVEGESDPQVAVRVAAAIDFVLDDGLSQAPRLHHGGGLATWTVLAAAIDKGHDVRIGLEDTLVLGNGRSAVDNAELVAAVGAMAVAGGRAIDTIP
jgi:uncharacterized protein (DUF849 family)